MDMKHVNVR